MQRVRPARRNRPGRPRFPGTPPAGPEGFPLPRFHRRMRKAEGQAPPKALSPDEPGVWLPMSAVAAPRRIGMQPVNGAATSAGTEVRREHLRCPSSLLSVHSKYFLSILPRAGHGKFYSPVPPFQQIQAVHVDTTPTASPGKDPARRTRQSENVGAGPEEEDVCRSSADNGASRKGLSPLRSADASL